MNEHDTLSNRDFNWRPMRLREVMKQAQHHEPVDEPVKPGDVVVVAKPSHEYQQCIGKVYKITNGALAYVYLPYMTSIALPLSYLAHATRGEVEAYLSMVADLSDSDEKEPGIES